MGHWLESDLDSERNVVHSSERDCAVDCDEDDSVYERELELFREPCGQRVGDEMLLSVDGLMMAEIGTRRNGINY